MVKFSRVKIKKEKSEPSTRLSLDKESTHPAAAAEAAAAARKEYARPTMSRAPRRIRPGITIPMILPWISGQPQMPGSAHGGDGATRASSILVSVFTNCMRLLHSVILLYCACFSDLRTQS